jgi:hypothetical protein
MSNEEKAKRLEEIAKDFRIRDNDAPLLRKAAQLMREREELREKAELLEWALDHVVDYGSRTLECVGGKYVIETPLRLKDPAEFAELDCDQWNVEYGFSALRAARGEK